MATHNINFQTDHSSTKKHTRSEQLTFATRNRRITVNRHQSKVTHNESRTEVNSNVDRSVNHIQPDRVQISDESKETQKSTSDSDKNLGMSSKDKLEFSLLRQMYSTLLDGEFEPIETVDTDEKKADSSSDAPDPAEAHENAPSAESADASNRGNGADFGFSYSYDEKYVESEKLTFKAEGKIETEDGESIDFDLDMNVSRRFFQETSVDIQAGNQKLIDPLVVNYDGKAAELSEKKMKFDLNADGVTDEISRIKKGSGFLALDKNENGKIDNGNELFGPQTGNGFEELAKHDSDKNRFIDSGDPVFDQLMIMDTSLTEGKKLISLEEAGIGAIFLGSADTDFTYKNPTDNALQGQLHRSGIFIGEDGDVGSVQQIELAANQGSNDSENTRSGIDITD